MSEPYEVRLSASAARPLVRELPEAVAAWRFIDGTLRLDLKRVGTQLRESLSPLHSARRGEYRVIYRIEDRFLLIDVVRITHRRDAYRT